MVPKLEGLVSSSRLGLAVFSDMLGETNAQRASNRVHSMLADLKVKTCMPSADDLQRLLVLCLELCNSINAPKKTRTIFVSYFHCLIPMKGGSLQTEVMWQVEATKRELLF